MIALPVAIISTAFADEVRRRDFVVTWGMLARVPLFSHLSATEIADIMRLLRARTIEFRRNPGAARRCRVLDVFHHRGRGRDRIAEPAHPARGRHVLGEIALLHRTKRSGTVTATRKTRLLALDAQDFHALIERMPTLAAHVQEDREGAARGMPVISPPPKSAQATHDDQPADK